MTSIWDLANRHLRELGVYEPGKPIEEIARELQVEPADIIKLASNENPFGPSPAAIRAMTAALQQAHLYPDGGGFYLRRAIADRLGVVPENVILGNGSNEIIEFLAHAFLNRGDSIVTSEYAFIAYKLIAALFGAKTIEARGREYKHDLPAILEAIQPNTRLIIIANPNNPTGTLISQREIDEFMKQVPDRVVTVFDEAYYEFLDEPPDTLRYVRAERNIVVLRTFSKIHGLAGTRIGYGVGSPALIEVLQKTRQPFNVNSIAQAGALAALTDEAHSRRTKQTVDAGRSYLGEALADIGVQFVPSAANFLMVNVGDGRRVFKEMLAQKVIVRPLTGYGLHAWVRISVGTMDENERCISALKEVLTKSKPA
jgi:histidinol-phosphate aminotransferase